MIEYIEYFFFIALRSIARVLPYRTAGRLGAFLGNAVFSLTNVRKEVTLDNLAKAFPEMSEAGRRAIARGAFRNYGIALVESFWTSSKTDGELREKVHVQNPEVMASALSRGKGVILLSAHYGSWELIPSSVRLNFDRPFVLLVQRQRNVRVDAIIDKGRTRFGNSSVPMGVSTRRILTALAEKQIVLMLGDQSGPKEAVFVDFFGRPSATHRGVAAFSLKTGAPIVAGFLVRTAGGTYDLTLEEVPRPGSEASTEENIIELTRHHVGILEKWIRKHPDHWLWMHKRWKHTPYYEQRQPVEEKVQ